MGSWSTTSPGVTFGTYSYLGVLNQTNYVMSGSAAVARGVGSNYYIAFRVRFKKRSGNYVPPANFRVYAAGDYSSYYYPPSSVSDDGTSVTYYYYGSGGSTSSTLEVATSVTAYTPGGSVSGTVQVPKIATYTVTYNANNGTSEKKTATKVSGTALTIAGNTFTKDRYSFTDWNTKADGTGTSYSSGDSYTTNAALTLYAQWVESAIPLYFNLSGSVIESDAIYIRVGDDIIEADAVYIRVGDDIIEV